MQSHQALLKSISQTDMIGTTPRQHPWYPHNARDGKWDVADHSDDNDDDDSGDDNDDSDSDDDDDDDSGVDDDDNGDNGDSGDDGDDDMTLCIGWLSAISVKYHRCGWDQSINSLVVELYDELFLSFFLAFVALLTEQLGKIAGNSFV